jgi:2-(1,2-epoxy-1,2-dihydrophenyl)acetyl-CoA isomerase
VVAARDARFCQVFVRRNVVPDLGSAWFLPRAVGALKAKEMLLLGEEWSAEVAHELGLMNRLMNRLVETRDDAEREALALAARMAEPAPATMAMTKDLVNRGQRCRSRTCSRSRSLLKPRRSARRPHSVRSPTS